MKIGHLKSYAWKGCNGQLTKIPSTCISLQNITQYSKENIRNSTLIIKKQELLHNFLNDWLNKRVHMKAICYFEINKENVLHVRYTQQHRVNCIQ
jgi:hypothetical protein